MIQRIVRALAPVSALFLISGGLWAAVEISPLPPGPYALGSTNMEVAEHPTPIMTDYLKGKATRKETKYVADILTHREAVPIAHLDVPADRARFGALAGTKLPLVLYVLYPTVPDNPRPDYKFPYSETGDNVFPHMQRPGEKPLFAGQGTRYPLIVYCTGYESHGLWDLEQLKALAAHGYIVVDIFHSDGRGVSFNGNVALRPIELTCVLDYMLSHPDFAGAIDPERVGVAGSSFGGYTILSAMGGADPASGRAGAADPRIKAGFGLVPMMGGRLGFWPFGIDAWVFGKDYAGLRSVRAPFLAIYGEKDSNVKPDSVEGGIAQLGGPASAVMLAGEKHLLSKAVWSDVNTWEVLFFNAWLRGDAEARKQLYGATSVRGGVNDHKTLQHAAR